MFTCLISACGRAKNGSQNLVRARQTLSHRPQVLQCVFWEQLRIKDREAGKQEEAGTDSDLPMSRSNGFIQQLLNKHYIYATYYMSSNLIQFTCVVMFQTCLAFFKNVKECDLKLEGAERSNCEVYSNTSL